LLQHRLTCLPLLPLPCHTRVSEGVNLRARVG
jgi:hypothetical protein